MQHPEPDKADAHQARFHSRWQHLNDPHVRSLAWLIDAPDLLDPKAAQWAGRVASLGDDAGDTVAGWLAELDRQSDTLHQHLALQPATRLGRYAESLMAFYLHHLGILRAHGVQVRASRNETIGEFDFLVEQEDGLSHWEFATKLYLLETSRRGLEADYFLGPNLADTLGAKMRKIFDHQLHLSEHPAAQEFLPRPVHSARALVKGWLFYHADAPSSARAIGVHAHHCRGFWKPLKEFHATEGRYAILSRLSWLAPVKLKEEQTLDSTPLNDALRSYFASEKMPVLLAFLKEENGIWLEQRRGFIVSDDWQERAEQCLAVRSI
jgi:hypothetical protein